MSETEILVITPVGGYDTIPTQGGGLGGLEKSAITQCAVDPKGIKKICSAPEQLREMKSFLVKQGCTPGSVRGLDTDGVLKTLKKKLNVETESEIYTHDAFRRHIGGSKADAILKDKFVPDGPSDSTALLDNFNIDNTLSQWASGSKKEFGKKFHHIPFQMIDFVSNNTELAKLSIPDLKKNGFDCFGVVLNTDVSTGRGKHWFAIYGDLQHTGTDDDPYVLEYFNSSGYPPRPEVSTWMETVKHDLAKDYKKHVKIVHATHKQIQYSRTECGVWSLVYILSRLLGKPPNWIATIGANDSDMIEFRKRLFK